MYGANISKSAVENKNKNVSNSGNTVNTTNTTKTTYTTKTTTTTNTSSTAYTTYQTSTTTNTTNKANTINNIYTTSASNASNNGHGVDLDITLSVVGLAGLFSTCLQILDVIAEASDYGKSVQDILMDIDFEHWKLLLWGESVGLINHTDSTRINKRMDKPNVRKLVYDQLVRLKRTFDDVEKFKEKYGIQHEQGQLTSTSIPPASLDIDTYRDNIKQRMLSRQQQASLRNKARWAFRGKPKLTNLVTDLKLLNEKLHSLVPVGDDSFEEQILEGVEAIISRRILQHRPATSHSFGGRSHGADGMEVRSIASPSSSSLSQTFYSVRSRILRTLSLRTPTSSSTDLTTDMDDGPKSQISTAKGKNPWTEKKERQQSYQYFRILVDLRYDVIYAELAFYFGYYSIFKDVVGLLKNILETTKKQDGKDHPNTLSAICNLVKHYREQKRHNDSAVLFKNLLEITEKNCGKESQITLSKMYCLAKFYREQKRFPDAETLLQNILGIQRKKYGFHNRALIRTMWELGITYREQNLLDKAEEHFKDGLDIGEIVLGRYHKNVSQIRVDLEQLKELQSGAI
ncbi:hypothetical protein RUND412_004575 [Rhizina undulata]